MFLKFDIFLAYLHFIKYSHFIKYFIKYIYLFLKFNIFLAYLHFIKCSSIHYCIWFEVDNTDTLLPFYCWERNPEKL